MVLQHQFDNQRFRFPVSRIVIYIFRPVLVYSREEDFDNHHTTTEMVAYCKGSLSEQLLTSYLKTGKSISLAANPSDRNAKLDLLVGLCSRVLNPINTLLNSWFPNFFHNNFRLWGKRCGAVKAFAFL